MRDPMSNGDRLKVARRVLSEIEDLDPSSQQDVLRCLSITDEHHALRRVLQILEPLTPSDRSAVEAAVSSLVVCAKVDAEPATYLSEGSLR